VPTSVSGVGQIIRGLPADLQPTAPPAPPVTPAPPTIDYKALAEQLKSQLVTVQADLDKRRTDLATLHAWADQIIQRAAAVSLATGQLMETIKQRPA
jgi:hypothetical protein